MEPNDKSPYKGMHKCLVLVLLVERLVALAAAVVAIAIQVLLITRVFDLIDGIPPTFLADTNLFVVWIVEGLLILLVSTLDASSGKTERGISFTETTYDGELGVELHRERIDLPYFVDGKRWYLLPWYMCLALCWPLLIWLPTASIKEEIFRNIAFIQYKRGKSQKKS